MCTPATLTHGWTIICCVSISFVLLRLSIDLIQTASQKTRKHFRESHHATTEEKTDSEKEKKDSGSTKKTGYGSIQDDTKEEKNINIDKSIQETARLLSSSTENKPSTQPSTLSLRFQGILLVVLLVISMLKNVGSSCVLSKGLVWSCITVILLGAILTYRDVNRERFGYLSRILYLVSALTLAIPMTTAYSQNRQSSFGADEVIVNIMCLYLLLAIGEVLFVPMHKKGSFSDDEPKDGKLSIFAISTLLKPYVWPDKTSDSAVMNRVRACMTWVCVILSKACNLSAPILVSCEFSFYCFLSLFVCIFFFY